MPTQQNNVKTLRLSLPKLIFNISVLYQNGEISMKEKDLLCEMAKKALASNNTTDLINRFHSLRFGSLFPALIDECIEIAQN